ncbi:transcriptional regulator, BadM/Rrf2 family [Streptococcus gallolyticus]|uniref:Putative transcriptional regulator n=1 Tax=Streptococcus gallolyticus TaxID=315405 RepID=A0A060RKZ3_9STRE|nr:Rrf2 family transcriptional regulator [Streptococcus gallolyticus]MCY7171177.1 Rrf2 family transcriptional regulator [Streptococcus gallolyticus subsp. gallolyticus]MCY7187928.1 Rrf2 family transcriptional regulator [Streptococcus gallolyticus subsp. gallolyticus]CDO18458.1 Putative transcriptional regulator [Streptococcus gallolyticus]SDK24838.1 transcriptional regulator, BadM/Rrf2 family [Streptococcus gallolyticus]SDL71071.1 transcriptional regulator, BadM/Rrf2 family [Streptococcus gall
MISTRGRYAIRVMIDLVENNNGHYIPLKDIAQRQEISKKYLEIIVKEMVAGELLIGASGRGGGYKLRRKPEEYTVGEILDLMEGTLSSVACLADKSFDCPRKDKCKTLPMWIEYDNLVHDFFYGKTILDLVNN